MSKGEKIKQCSKRYLRKPFREEIAKQLQGKSVEVYRSELATELMDSGDEQDLFHSEVLLKCKSEWKIKQYMIRILYWRL